MAFFRLTELFYCFIKKWFSCLESGLIHGLVSQTGALFIPLSKIQNKNLGATQVPKRQRTWILEKRKHNFYKASMHFFGIEKFTQDFTNLGIQNLWTN